MNLIKDGNFIPWFRALIWVSGLVVVALSYFFLEGRLMFWGVVIGTVVASIGAYAEKANTLRLKPFDNTYKKARDSYDKEKDSSSNS